MASEIRDLIEQCKTKTQERLMVEDEVARADKLTKFQLIDKLVIMTKFTEVFLKKMDEEALRSIYKAFMSMGKPRIVKDLGVDPTHAQSGPAKCSGDNCDK